MSGYDQICKDIALKCGQDVNSTMLRNMRLMRDGDQMAMVAVSGMAVASAIATGAIFAEEASIGTIPDKALDSMWDTLIKPMMRTAMGDVWKGTMSDILDMIISFKKATNHG